MEKERKKLLKDAIIMLSLLTIGIVLFEFMTDGIYF